MSNLYKQTIRLAYTNTILRPHLLAALKQGAKFTLYDEYLAWIDELYAKGSYSQPGNYTRMDRTKAENYSKQTFQMLEQLWLKDMDTEAKLYTWASRIRDPNVAVSLAYTAHKLTDASFTRFDSEYFFQNWQANAARFKAFGALVERACAARFWEIVGRDSRVKPVAPPAAKSTFTPPRIPPNLIPVTAESWQLYDVPGANKAARALASTMETILSMAGQNILPTNDDVANVKMVNQLRVRMRKVLSTYQNYGATDGDSESVFEDVLYNYITLYLNPFDFPKTFAALRRI